jgi:hypothetical protein
MKLHPGNRIMRDFYHAAHAAKLESSTLPSILGLTASVDIAKIPWVKLCHAEHKCN